MFAHCVCVCGPVRVLAVFAISVRVAILGPSARVACAFAVAAFQMLGRVAIGKGRGCTCTSECDRSPQCEKGRRGESVKGEKTKPPSLSWHIPVADTEKYNLCDCGRTIAILRSKRACSFLLPLLLLPHVVAGLVVRSARGSHFTAHAPVGPCWTTFTVPKRFPGYVFFSDSGPGQKNRLYRIGIYIELQRPFERLAVTTRHTRAPWLYRFGCVRTRGRKCETKRPHHSLCEDGVTSIKNTETLKHIGQWCAGGDGPRVADRARPFPVLVGRGSSSGGKVCSAGLTT